MVITPGVPQGGVVGWLTEGSGVEQGHARRFVAERQGVPELVGQ